MTDDELVEAMRLAFSRSALSDGERGWWLSALNAIRPAIRNAALEEAAGAIIYQAAVLKAPPGSAIHHALEYVRLIVLALKREPRNV